MKYCKICLDNNLRPNTSFTSNQICPSCNFLIKNKNEKKINNYKNNILLEITNKYKLKEKTNFDCIIGVSGGKDSTRQAIWVRDKLGLRPLLACLSYPPEQISDLGTRNISNLINLGFDVICSSLAPETWKILIKESFFKFGNWAKSTELALFSFVPQLAIKFKIPLILWGENPGLQGGDTKSQASKGYDGKNLKNLNTLAGGDLSWISKKIIKKINLSPYTYPNKIDFNKNNLRIIYIGWFLDNWSPSYNAMSAISNGLEIRNKKFKNYGDILGITSLDEDWVTFNQLIKYYKYGFGRATDYMNDEIRTNKITREEAIKIVKKYDGVYSKKIISDFCNYLNITPNLFWSNIKKFVNKKLFLVTENKITPKFIPGKDF